MQERELYLVKLRKTQWMDGEDLSEANLETGTWSSSLIVFDRVFRPELEEQPSIENAGNGLVPFH